MGYAKLSLLKRACMGILRRFEQCKNFDKRIVKKIYKLSGWCQKIGSFLKVLVEWSKRSLFRMRLEHLGSQKCDKNEWQPFVRGQQMVQLAPLGCNEIIGVKWFLRTDDRKGGAEVEKPTKSLHSMCTMNVSIFNCVPAPLLKQQNSK